jgi:hypothetical protein
MTSHRRWKFRRSVAAGLAVAALAVPAAQASPIRDPGAGDTPGPAAIDVTPVETESAPAVTTLIDEGFDWGSAAIGAGGAAAVLLLGAAGASALSALRHRIGINH